MRILNKSLIGSAFVLCSTAIFAACPPITGYQLINERAVGNGVCVYQSTQPNPAAANNSKLCYPDWRLTDPNYKVSCAFNQFTRKCTCTLNRIR